MDYELSNVAYAAISYAFELGTMYAFFFFLMKCRFRRKLCTYIVGVTLNVIIDITIKLLLPNPGVMRTVISCSLMTAIILVCFSEPFKRRIIIAISALMILALADGMGLILLKLIYPLEWDGFSGFEEPFRISIVFVNGMIFLFCTYFAVFWRLVVNKKRIAGELLFLFIPTYQIFLLVMYYRACQDYSVMQFYFGIGVTLMGVIIDFLFMYFINGMEQKIEVEEKLSNLYTQRQYELDYYKMTNQHIEEMREVRHDFKNQIQTAYIMLEQGADKEKIRQMLGETSKRMEESKVQKYCENPVVNALLTVKRAKALEKGIAMEIQCNVVEQFAGIEEIDLCSLVGNLLDNAIEACEKLAEEEQREICIKAGERGGYQIFRVENTYRETPLLEDGKIKTSKPEMDKHGYGLKMVERICNKYHGKMEVCYEKGIFEVLTWLQLTEDK